MPTFNQSSKDNASNLERQAKDAANIGQAAAGNASRGVSDKAYDKNAQKMAPNAANQKAEDLRGERKPADKGIGAKMKGADASGLDNARNSLDSGKNKK